MTGPRREFQVVEFLPAGRHLRAKQLSVAARLLNHRPVGNRPLVASSAVMLTPRQIAIGTVPACHPAAAPNDLAATVFQQEL